jgi:hypothetical protein
VPQVFSVGPGEYVGVDADPVSFSSDTGQSYWPQEDLGRDISCVIQPTVCDFPNCDEPDANAQFGPTTSDLFALAKCVAGSSGRRAHGIHLPRSASSICSRTCG